MRMHIPVAPIAGSVERSRHWAAVLVLAAAASWATIFAIARVVVERH